MTLSQNSKVDLFRTLVYLLNTATDFIIALLLLAWKWVTNYAERYAKTALTTGTTHATDTTPTTETTLTPGTTSKISQKQDGGCEVRKILPINNTLLENKKHHSLHLSLRYIMFGGDHWQFSSSTFRHLWPFLTSTGRFPRLKDTVYSGSRAC